MKSKNKVMKAALYGLAALLVLYAWISIYGFKENVEKGRDFLSYSAQDSGTKALFLLSEKMGYKALRYEEPSRLLEGDGTMVAVNPGFDRFNQPVEVKYLKSWLEKGNTLILSVDEDIKSLLDLKEFQKGYKGTEDMIRVGMGKIYILNNADDFLNSGVKSITPGVEFIEILDTEGHKRVLFNEYYHGLGKANVNVWDLIGPTGILVVTQIVLGIAVLLYIRSRRFGKPVVVFETIKRKENENLFALSNIYLKAQANSLVLENYLIHFKKELSKFLGFSYTAENNELVTASLSNHFLKNYPINEMLVYCESYIKNDSKDSKGLLNMILTMDEIRKGIK